MQDLTGGGTVLQGYRRILLFVGLYLLLAVPPYLVLNPGVVATVLADLYPPSVPQLVAVVVLSLALLAVLVRTSAGIDRYAQFLVSPTDWLSVLVVCSFLLAAASWWAVPELVLRTQGRVSLNLLYFLVFLGHVPMLLFLSLLSAAALTQPGG